MSELNVAVVGCGGMGDVHLARWSEVSGARIAAVCDLDTAAATRAAAQFGAEAHTDWRALVQSAGLDIIDICTPPNLHRDIAIAALDRGLHVLCEKPLARTSAEAREMVGKAEENGRMLMTAFCHRFHPPVLFAKDLIENDDLGRIVMFRSRFSGSFPGIEGQWFSDPEISGGGALLDTGVHSIDLFRYLVGEVTSASGKSATVNPKLHVEDCAVATLQSEGGALGVVETSWSTPGGRNVLELYGTAGACIIDYESNQVRYKTADMAVWDTREIAGPDRFQCEILHFADAVRGLQPLLSSGHDGLRAIEIVEEILTTAT
jgi:predicted dehydrogenase